MVKGRPWSAYMKLCAAELRGQGVSSREASIVLKKKVGSTVHPSTLRAWALETKKPPKVLLKRGRRPVSAAILNTAHQNIRRFLRRYKNGTTYGEIRR